MKRLSLFVVAAAAVAAAGVARAHIGANVAVCTFMTPPDPGIMHADPNDTVPTPYSWPTADTSFLISWSDGDTDPTGRWIFYYMDHLPNFEVSADDIEGGAAGAIKIQDATNLATGYYASCYCNGDQGVTCPTVVRDPSTNCANQFTWDTSQIPNGTYWIIAVNNDPPFHVAYPASAPVRIVHGSSTAPPAALIVRPDGYGSWDKSYRVQWLADGKPPLTFDLSYALEDTGAVAFTPMPIASALQLQPGSDGTYTYDWDTSQLDANKAFWVRLKVTDANGMSTFTDSHFGVTISHSGAITPPDMAMAPAKKKSGCDVGAVDDGAPARGSFALVAVLAALALAYFVARRAARRG